MGSKIDVVKLKIFIKPHQKIGNKTNKTKKHMKIHKKEGSRRFIKFRFDDAVAKRAKKKTENRAGMLSGCF